MAPPRPPGTQGLPARLLLPLLCWALASRRTDAVALPSPSITIVQTLSGPPRLGESVTASCEAVSCLPEFTLLYWLGNGSFVEKLHLEPPVREGTVLEKPLGSGTTLSRDLHIDSFSTQHLHTNFTCVLLSPLGTHTRELRWLHPTPAPARTTSRGHG